MDRLTILTEITKSLLQSDLTWENELSYEENLVDCASLITSLILKKEAEMDQVEEEHNDTAEMNQIMMDNPVNLNREMMEHPQLPEAARNSEQLRLLPSIEELEREQEQEQQENHPNVTRITNEEIW